MKLTKKIFTTLLVILVCSNVFAFSVVSSSSNHKDVFTVQFIGDSITVGQGGTATVGGWRHALLKRINAARGITIKSVGWQSQGSFGQNKCSAISGQRTDEALINFSPEILAYKANAYFIHLGTNDATQRNSGTCPAPTCTEAKSVANIGSILDLIRSNNPTAHVFVALIIPNQTAGADTLITSFNSALSTAIAARSDTAYVHVVDMNAAFRANGSWSSVYMLDTTHPNDAGNTVMENTWFTSYSSVFN